MSGLFSSNKSQTQQQSTAFGQSFVDPNQQFFLSQLRGAATGVAAGALGPTQGIANQLGGPLLNTGLGFLGGLQGQAGGVPQAGAVSPLGQFAGLGEALGGLQQFAGQGPGGLPGTDLIQQAGQGAPQLLQQNPALGAQIGSLQAFLQQNLAATSGTIAGQATLGGSTGGSRQALATGLAGQETVRQFGAGASALLGQDFAQRQALAPQLLQTQLQAGLALQGGSLAQTQQQLQALQGLGGAAVAGGVGQAQGAAALAGAQAGLQQAGTAAAGQQTAAALGGIEALPGLFNLGLAPASAQFGPLLQLAAILGDPAILSTSTSQGTSRTKASGFSIFAGEGS